MGPRPGPGRPHLVRRRQQWRDRQLTPCHIDPFNPHLRIDGREVALEQAELLAVAAEGSQGAIQAGVLSEQRPGLDVPNVNLADAGRYGQSPLVGTEHEPAWTMP